MTIRNGTFSPDINQPTSGIKSSLNLTPRTPAPQTRQPVSFGQNTSPTHAGQIMTSRAVPKLAPAIPPPAPYAGQNVLPQAQPQYQQPMQYAPQPQYQQPMYYPAQLPQRSLEQTVQNNNPQSVQNFLSALHQSGAGGNNNFMNGAGQQGQQAQAGFQGFQSNGQYASAAPVMYNGPMNSQLGYSNNMSHNNVGPRSVNNEAVAGNINQNSNIVNQADMSTFNRYTPPTNWGVMNADGSGYGGGIGTYVPPNGENTNTTGQAITKSGDPILVGDQAEGMRNNLGSMMGAISDVNSKQNINPGKSEMEDFLDSLGVYSYEYKNKKYGEGRRISPMAQEIESTPLGKDAISINKEGYKQVDYGKLAGTQLAATAYINDKLNKLAEQLKTSIPKSISDKKKKDK